MNLVDGGQATDTLIAGPAYTLHRTSSTPELHRSSRRRAVWVVAPAQPPADSLPPAGA